MNKAITMRSPLILWLRARKHPDTLRLTILFIEVIVIPLRVNCLRFYILVAWAEIDSSIWGNQFSLRLYLSLWGSLESNFLAVLLRVLPGLLSIIVFASDSLAALVLVEFQLYVLRHFRLVLNSQLSLHNIIQLARGAHMISLGTLVL